MSDITKGAGFNIVPGVDRAAMSAAEAQIAGLVTKASRAIEQGNDKVLANVSAKLAKKLGQQAPEIDVKVNYKVDTAKGGIKEIKTLSAGALDPMIKDYKKMVDIQGEAALGVKQELALQKQKLQDLKQQAQTLGKLPGAYKRNVAEQKKVLDNTTKLEGVLKKVQTAASLKGQLREASQRLSMTSQYTTAINKQGQLITVTNQKWVAQKAVVQGLQQQVTMAGVATQGFGAKVAAAGATMQAAFGWIAAVVAGITAIAGAVGRVTGRVKDIQSLKLTFDGLGQSVQAQNGILDSSKRIALSYGVSLRKVEGAFRRLGPAILESGGSLRDTESAIESIAARTTMLGLNTEQSGRYIEAFAQVMGKGKLQSEELNQQFSELDGGLRGQLKNWLAANKGITDFEGAMKRGEITSGVFLEAFEAINEEIRGKFLRSIGDTQKAISGLGEEGGMTLNQLNAKLGTLTSIGLESVAHALAPIGKELMKVYAAFVQVFTKIATEMPGIQGMFRVVGHIIGVVIKVALNSVLGLFLVVASVADKIWQFFGKIYDVVKKIMVLGARFGGNGQAMENALKGMEDGAKGLNNNFDNIIDNMTRLSDETTGAKANLEQYTSKVAELDRLQKTTNMSQEEYARRRAKIDQEYYDKLETQNKDLLNQTIENFKTALEKRKEQFEEEKTMYERKIEDINLAKDEELEAIDAVIRALQKQKSEYKKVYDKKIRSMKRAYDEEQAQIASSQRSLKSQERGVKSFYDRASQAMKEHYSQKKAAMEASHRKEMAMINASIAALRTKQSLESKALDMGPEAEKLNLMKAADMRKQAASETNALKKQELLAQAESFENEVKRHEMEMQHIRETAIAEARRRRAEARHAKEKEKLMKEEKKAQEEMDRARQAALDKIARATESLASQMRQSKEDEKQGIEALKDEQRDLGNVVDKELEKEKDKRREVVDAAKEKVDELKAKIREQEREIQDIEFAFTKVSTAVGGVGVQADIVTNGALDRMLGKIMTIQREAAKIKVGKAKAADAGGQEGKASGGPVTGGTTYTVNELGKEGFLSASGRLSEINAPAWGSWKAPGAGTVIPAHVWKSLKATQVSDVSMPKTANPGNGVAHAISTISNRGGDQFNNSVTIQAANPVQAANNVMVEMTRLRRRRFR